jgi:hypothetical protein
MRMNYLSRKFLIVIMSAGNVIMVPLKARLLRYTNPSAPYCLLRVVITGTIVGYNQTYWSPTTRNYKHYALCSTRFTNHYFPSVTILASRCLVAVSDNVHSPSSWFPHIPWPHQFLATAAAAAHINSTPEVVQLINGCSVT